VVREGVIGGLGEQGLGDGGLAEYSAEAADLERVQDDRARSRGGDVHALLVNADDHAGAAAVRVPVADGPGCRMSLPAEFAEDADQAVRSGQCR
jgi:hypothetical protein